MPYNLNNPPNLIKSLPQNAKRIWIKAFNSNYNENKDEKDAIKAGWGAVKNAGYKKINNEWKRWN